MQTQIYNNLLTLLSTPQHSDKSSDSANLQQPPSKELKQSNSDIIQLSKETKTVTLNQTRLISETTEQIENGYRRTQKFQNAAGKTFTRIEEFTSSNNQSRRTVVQQNASGSTNRLEDVFDRKEDGSFRLTQRYTNEVGEILVNIEPNAQPPNSDIILGREPSVSQLANSAPSRGNEIDLMT